MRDAEVMARVAAMIDRGNGMVIIEHHTGGRRYLTTTGNYLNGQIISDMIADGWLVGNAWDTALRLVKP